MTTTIDPAAFRRAARIAKPSAGQRLEGVVLVLILLTVGGFAGAASFTHVHDWTMHNSPAGTGDWFGWANAVVSELVPIAALLVMRRRRRSDQSITYPAALLVSALALSITAQLAVAKPGFFGGLVSVVPALAFAALAKLVLGKAPRPETTTNPIVAFAADLPEETPSPQVNDMARTVPANLPSTQDDQPKQPEPVPVEPKHEPKTWPTPPLPVQLLDKARQAAQQHQTDIGRPIGRDELQKVLRVSNATTGEVMRALGLREPAKSLTPAAAVSPLTGKPLL